MANKQIDELGTFTAIDRSVDLLPLLDVSADEVVMATLNQMLGFSGGAPVSTSDTQTLTNKVIGITNTVTLVDTLFKLQDNADNAKQAQFQLSGITSGQTRVYTLPDANDTLVGKATIDTLTNKTISGGAINNATIDNPVLQTDTVSEHTSANGVTVDGLNIKDGKLNTANSIVTSNVTDDAITPAKLKAGTGTSWNMQVYTPALTNITLGNGTLSAKYIQTGKMVRARGEYIAGSGSSVGGNIAIALPVTARNDAGYEQGVAIIGTANIFNSGVNQYLSAVYLASTTTMALQIVNTSGTNATTSVSANATVPFTWSGANGGIIWDVEYEAA